MILIIKCGLWRVWIIEGLDNRGSDNRGTTVLFISLLHFSNRYTRTVMPIGPVLRSATKIRLESNNQGSRKFTIKQSEVLCSHYQAINCFVSVTKVWVHQFTSVQHLCTSVHIRTKNNIFVCTCTSTVLIHFDPGHRSKYSLYWPDCPLHKQCRPANKPMQKNLELIIFIALIVFIHKIVVPPTNYHACLSVSSTHGK